MTELDESVCDVLSAMPVLPAEVGRDVLVRLSRIEAAIADEMIEEGTILVQFRDLAGDLVVLCLVVRDHFAFLEVSASEEGVALSNGYSFSVSDRGVITTVDETHRLSRVDHAHQLGAWIATERALTMLEEARALMRTHPAFASME